MEQERLDDGVYETETGVLIEVTAPDKERDDFSIRIEDDTVEVRIDGEDDREFSLPDGVDKEEADATYREGILRITIPHRRSEYGYTTNR
jgi:HSP20 family molecular chaperone IbpA